MQSLSLAWAPRGPDPAPGQTPSFIAAAAAVCRPAPGTPHCPIRARAYRRGRCFGAEGVIAVDRPYW